MKYFLGMFFLCFGLLWSATGVLASDLSEDELNAYFLEHGMSEEELSHFSKAQKEIIYEDIVEDGLENPQIDADIGESMEFYFNHERELIEFNEPEFGTMSTIPTSDLSLSVNTVATSDDNIRRIFANYEFLTSEAQPNDYIGISVNNDFDTISSSYECSQELNGSQISTCGGAPFEVDSANTSAAWSFSNTQNGIYEGFGSMRITTNLSNPTTNADIQYASDISSAGSATVNFGVVSVSFQGSDQLLQQSNTFSFVW